MADAAVVMRRLALRADNHLAPAKINLALHVTGRRPDGYHTLSSLVAFAAIGDGLSVAPASADRFEATGPFAAALAGALPPGAPNIVVAALARLRERARLHSLDIGPLHIALRKTLPVASGIGGGSADAAALLRLGLRAAPGLEADIAAIALELGADVPMCVAGAAARVSGIGETIAPLTRFPRVPAVLVNPGVPVATPLVFRALARRDNPPMPELPPLAGVGPLVDFLRATRNDLEAPARRIAPVIGEALEALRSAGALLARMSGSGATVFGLFADDAEAARAAATIRAAEPGWWTVATTLGSMREDVP